LSVLKKKRELLMDTMDQSTALILLLSAALLERNTALEDAWEEELVLMANASAKKDLKE